MKLRPLGNDNPYFMLMILYKYLHLHFAFKKYSQQHESCRDQTHNVTRHDDIRFNIDSIRMMGNLATIGERDLCVPWIWNVSR